MVFLASSRSCLVQHPDQIVKLTMYVPNYCDLAIDSEQVRFTAKCIFCATYELEKTLFGDSTAFVEVRFYQICVWYLSSVTLVIFRKYSIDREIFLRRSRHRIHHPIVTWVQQPFLFQNILLTVCFHHFILR